MSRLREGRANTARGAAHFLRETVGRVRYAGANGRSRYVRQRVLPHGVVSVCRMDVRFSGTIRQHKSLHNLIEAIPEDAWTPIPYRMDGAADGGRDHLHPLPGRGGTPLPVRLSRPAQGEADARFPTGPLRQIQLSWLHHRPGRGVARPAQADIAATPGSRCHTRPPVRRRG